LILPALRRADRELRGGLITSQKYQAIVEEASSAIDKLVQIALTAKLKAIDAAKSESPTKNEASTSLTPETSAPTNPNLLRIATYDFGDERASHALRVLLANQPLIDASPIENWTPIVARRLMRYPPDTFLVSITRVEQRDEAVAFAKMLRKSGYQGWIVLGWWKSKSLRQSTRRQLKEAGFDYVTHRMKSMDRMLRFAVESTPQDENPTDSTDPVMVAAG